MKAADRKKTQALPTVYKLNGRKQYQQKVLK